MRRHIIWAFLIVNEPAIAIAHQIEHKCFDISAHVDIGVLRNNQRCTGMLNKYIAEPQTDLGIADITGYLVSNFVSSSTRGSDA